MFVAKLPGSTYAMQATNAGPSIASARGRTEGASLLQLGLFDDPRKSDLGLTAMTVREPSQPRGRGSALVTV